MSSRAAKWAGANGGALGSLGLSSNDLVVGIQTVIAIIGATAGSTLTATGLPAGWVLNSAARTITGAAVAGLDVSFTLTETLSGKVNSPKPNALRLAVRLKLADYDPTAEEVRRFAVAADPYLVSRSLSANSATYYDTLGDSLLEQEDASPTGLLKTSVNFMNQLNYRPSFNNRLRRGVNGAKSGYMSSEYLLLYLPAILASKSPIVVMRGALNDIQSGVTADQVLNGYTYGSQPHGFTPDSTFCGGTLGAIRQITAQGKRIVVFTDHPQQGTAYIQQFLRYNAALREAAYTNPLVTLIDTWPLLIDGAAATTATILKPALFQLDAPLQHVNMAGAMLIAEQLEAKLGPFVPPVDQLRVSSRHDGPLAGLTAALITNINWNSLFQEGSAAGPSWAGAGSFAGAGTLTSGTVPGGYRLVAPAGFSITLTTPPGPIGNNLRLAITAGGAGAVTLTQGLNANGQTGQNRPLSLEVLQEAAMVSVGAGSSNFAGVQLDSLYAGDVSVVGGANYCSGANMNAGPTTAYQQSLAAPRKRLSTNVSSSNCYSRVTCVFTGAGSATVDIAQFENRIRSSL